MVGLTLPQPSPAKLEKYFTVYYYALFYFLRLLCSVLLLFPPGGAVDANPFMPKSTFWYTPECVQNWELCTSGGARVHVWWTTHSVTVTKGTAFIISFNEVEHLSGAPNGVGASLHHGESVFKTNCIDYLPLLKDMRIVQTPSCCNGNVQ